MRIAICLVLITLFTLGDSIPATQSSKVDNPHTTMAVNDNRPIELTDVADIGGNFHSNSGDRNARYILYGRRGYLPWRWGYRNWGYRPWGYGYRRWGYGYPIRGY
uniref:Putative neuropeptide-like protein 32 n=1 Tax=Haematobia irritans TaxID=7368 RepID=A0A1L8EJ02_HAEIR